MRNEIEAGRAAMPEERKRTSDGGMAFPAVRDNGFVEHRGMSLRDYFAARASDADVTAFMALGLSRAGARYAFADAMLAERGA